MAQAAGLPHLRALHQITEVAARAPDAEALVECALDVLVGALGADTAAVLLLDDEGTPSARPQAHPGTGPPDAATAVSIPLLSRGRTLGEFRIGFHDGRALTPDECDLAEAIAAHVAFGIDQRRLEAELRLANAALATTLVAVPDSITVQAPDGRLLFANDDAAAFLGYDSPDELIAAGTRAVLDRFHVWDEHGAPVDLRNLPGRRAIQGEEPPEMLLRYRRVDTDEDRWSLVTARPVRADDGTVRFAVNVFRDVTQRQQAVRRERFLAAASHLLLDSALDYHSLLERVADLFVPDMADLCVVREFGGDGSVQRVAVRHSDAVDDGLVAQILALPDPLPGSELLNGVQAGRAALFTEVEPGGAHDVNGHPEYRSLVARLGVRSALMVPISARGEPVGAISLLSTTPRPVYGPADTALAEEVARRAGLALAGARLFAERSTVASTLQRALLPPVLPHLPGLELAARYTPAASEIGGDFYDVLPVGPSQWVVVVGDVCGKGIEAASLTAMVRYTLRAFAPGAAGPADLLSQVNGALARQLGSEAFCTVACGLLEVDASGARVTLSLAGHPRPLLVSPDGSVRAVGVPGSLLGAFPAADLADATVELGAGEALVVFTDGCVGEIPTGSDEDRLARAVAGVAAATGCDAARLAAAVEAAAPPGATHTDDLTVLVLRRPAEPPTA